MARWRAIRTWVVAVLLLFVLMVPPSAQDVDDETPSKVDHRETPVAAPDEPVRRENQPRSPRTVVTVNGATSVQVNVDGAQMNIVGDAANEPTIAVDPTDPNNIVIGWRQFGTIASDFRQAGMAYSHDGGATWTYNGPLDPAQFRSDPVLAVDSFGDFYYYSLSSITTTEYFISTDKGVTWTLPSYSPGGDKNWQTIDTSGGTGDGHIYPIWNSQFTCCGPGTDFSRSTNGAATFEGPYGLPEHPKWGTNIVGPDGELYVAGRELTDPGHLILRSDDADTSGAPPIFVAHSFDLGGQTVAGGAPNPGGLLGQVWVDVDRTASLRRGWVYVVGSVVPSGSDPLDVHFVRSKDGGATWSTPVRVNDDPVDGNAYNWFASMSVAPSGRIDVTWNDTRGGPSNTSVLYYAYSTDAGQTFSAGLPVSPPFNSTIGWPVQNKIGDYYHMVSLPEYAALAYSATFNGEQDVYFVRVGDCNANGTHDATDISGQTSSDVNSNGIPDECEADCNDNLVPDATDIANGTSLDCNANGVPDECDLTFGASKDCNENGQLDECEIYDNFELDPGFVVGDPGDTATSGIWVLVDPNGTAAQPEDDHTPGSGRQCYVTGQGAVGGSASAADVDGGATTLISASIDLSANPNPWLGYWRWYSNDTGGSPGQDTFVVDVSNDGGSTWSNVEVVGPSGVDAAGGWRFHTFRVAEIVSPTNDVKLRFIASDFGGASNVEAAIDDLVLVDCAPCALAAPGEVGNLRLSLAGVVADLQWDAAADADTYAIYRGGQRDATDLDCFASGIAGTTSPDDGLVPASGGVLFYVATAVNCGGESTLGAGRTPLSNCP